MEEDLVTRLRKRAEIRRQIPTRKSVQLGEADRIANLLDEAATEIERLQGVSMKTQWTVITEEDENGDTILPFPEDMLIECDWQEGDILNFIVQDDGSCIVENLTKNDRNVLPGNIEC